MGHISRLLGNEAMISSTFANHYSLGLASDPITLTRGGAMQYMRLTELQRHELMESLAAMKTFLRDTFESLTPQEIRTPGPAGSFSPVEQVWHLADLEREGFGLRIRRLQTEANPRLPDFDGTKAARERNYRSLSLAEGLPSSEAARAANIESRRAASKVRRPSASESE